MRWAVEAHTIASVIYFDRGELINTHATPTDKHVVAIARHRANHGSPLLPESAPKLLLSVVTN